MHRGCVVPVVSAVRARRICDQARRRQDREHPEKNLAQDEPTRSRHRVGARARTRAPTAARAGAERRAHGGSRDLMSQAVSALLIYMVKSCGGVRLSRAQVEPYVLAQDRRWMLIDDAGEFLSLRRCSRMALVRVAPSGPRFVLE